MLSLFEKYSKISWLFVILIALFIFYTSSLTFPPGIYVTSINSILYHFFAFFFLAFFLLPALVKGKNRSLIFIAIILAVMYGISDEFHQLFVHGRVSSFSDFLINSTGILLASLFYTISLKFRKNI